LKETSKTNSLQCDIDLLSVVVAAVVPAAAEPVVAVDVVALPVPLPLNHYHVDH
jgi:hypothetical protein